MIVLIAEGMDESGVQLLKESRIQCVTPADAFDHKDVHGIIVRSVFKVNARTAEEFPNLRLVAKLGTGLDNIDLDFCRNRNIEVLHTPGINSVSTAEFTVMQILNIYKNAYGIYERIKKRDYRRNLYFGRELADEIVGLIGFGSVGKSIAERMTPFVKKVLIYDRKNDRELQDSLLSQSNILILAVTLEGNEKMVGSAFLKKLRPDVLLVNIARGGLVDEQALTNFLKKNPKARYYCDVLTKEPDYNKAPESQDYQNSLLELPNVFFTPHIASLTAECQKKIALEMASKVIKICVA